MTDNNISNPVCRARGYHDWRTTKAPGLDRCASCGHTRLTPAKSHSEQVKRYQVLPIYSGPTIIPAQPANWRDKLPAPQIIPPKITGYMVRDSWTGKKAGRYPTKGQAQARARLLNSRAS